MKAMPRCLLYAGALLLCSCGTFQLASNISSPAGKSAEEQQSDILFCKDQADLAVNSGAHQAGDFLLGFTLIGAPVAYQLDKEQEREVFAQCMTNRGYNLVMPDGSFRQAPSSPNTPTHEPIQIAATSNSAGVSLQLPAGWVAKEIPSNLAAQGVFILAANYNIDSGVVVSSIKKIDIVDFKAFVLSREKSQADRLTDSISSEISYVDVNGRFAGRFTVTGVTNGIRITYLHTLIEGQRDIVDVNAWTSSSNFAAQQATLASLATLVTGI